MSKTRFTKIGLPEIGEELNKRLNRLSGGAAIFAVRELFDKAVKNPKQAKTILDEALEQLDTINQPTFGRKQIVADIKDLVYTVFPQYDVQSSDKTVDDAPVEKSQQEIDDEAKAEALLPEPEETEAPKVEETSEVDINAGEEIKATGKSWEGKKRKVTKTLLKKNPDLKWLTTKDHIYVHEGVVTAFIVSEEFAVSDKNLHGLPAGDVIVMDKTIVLN